MKKALRRFDRGSLAVEDLMSRADPSLSVPVHKAMQPRLQRTRPTAKYGYCHVDIISARLVSAALYRGKDDWKLRSNKAT